MNTLLTGASGFIGSAIHKALSDAGHTVVRGVRRPQIASDIAVDFLQDTDASIWQPRLQGIDAVINAVGLLGGTEQRMNTVQVQVPAALAAACALQGIGKFIQISALGVNERATTRYYRSKYAGEQAVRVALPSAHIVRPSLVYGKDGDSSRMFRNLTHLPLLMLPDAGRMLVQPVHVNDVALTTLRLLEVTEPQTLTALGAEPLSLADYLASLAKQLGRRAPRVLAMPSFLARTSAQLMQYLPQHVWTPDTLDMLLQGNTGEVSEVRALEVLLGKPLTPVSEFVHTKE